MRFMPSRKYKSGWRWCFFRWTDVDPVGEGKIYLTRFHLFQTPWCSAMLHWINLPDPQVHLHDHPNDFISLVLRGYYEEEIPIGGSSELEVRRRKWINFVKAEQKHRIVKVSNNTITLVFANRVRREWGFWVGGRLVSWRDYRMS